MNLGKNIAMAAMPRKYSVITKKTRTATQKYSCRNGGIEMSLYNGHGATPKMTYAVINRAVSVKIAATSRVITIF
jgi:hypothetical protein